jgi:hypothetical protein
MPHLFGVAFQLIWEMKLNEPRPAASEFLVIAMPVYKASLIEEKNF